MNERGERREAYDWALGLLAALGLIVAGAAWVGGHIEDDTLIGLRYAKRSLEAKGLAVSLCVRVWTRSDSPLRVVAVAASAFVFLRRHGWGVLPRVFSLGALDAGVFPIDASASLRIEVRAPRVATQSPARRSRD